MPTFTQIGTAQVVGAGGAADITFSSIPSTYTDLCLVFSVRSTRSANFDAVFLRVNGDTGSSHSYRFLRGSGSSPDSGNNGAASFVYVGQIPAATSTSSTFQNASVYLPNYATSSSKSMSSDSVSENNATEAWALLTAGLWSNSSAITSLRLYPENGPNFAQHSTAYLYGVSNA